MNASSPIAGRIARSTPGEAVATRLDPVVAFFVDDANTATLRANTVLQEELKAHGHISISTSTLRRAQELADVATAFARTLTLIANQSSVESSHSRGSLSPSAAPSLL